MSDPDQTAKSSPCNQNKQIPSSDTATEAKEAAINNPDDQTAKSSPCDQNKQIPSSDTVTEAKEAAINNPDDQTTKSSAGHQDEKISPPPDPIAEAERTLKEAQRKLEQAKKKKADDEKRQKDQDAIKKQRQTSQNAINDACKDYEKWQDYLNKQIPQLDRDKLNTGIEGVDDEVIKAEKEVTCLNNELAKAKTALETANKTLVATQAQYAAKQRELNQLAANIKDVQSRIDKLLTELKAALDAKKWTHAYYKNYRLKQALDEAAPLLDSNQTEQQILDALKSLEGSVLKQQDAVEDAKNQCDIHTAELAAATEELKRKKAIQEAAIEALL